MFFKYHRESQSPLDPLVDAGAPLSTLLSQSTALATAVASNNRKVVTYLCQRENLNGLLDLIVGTGGADAVGGDDGQDALDTLAGLASQLLSAEPGTLAGALLESGDGDGEGPLFVRCFEMDTERPRSILACGVLAALLRRASDTETRVRDAIRDHGELVRTMAISYPLSSPVLALMYEMIIHPGSSEWVAGLGILEAFVSGVSAPMHALPGNDDAACSTRDASLWALKQWVEWSQNPLTHSLRVYLLKPELVATLVRVALSSMDWVAAAGAVDVLADIVAMVELSRMEAKAPTVSPRPALDPTPLVETVCAGTPIIAEALQTALAQAGPGRRLGLFAYKIVHLIALLVSMGDLARVTVALTEFNVAGLLIQLIEAYPCHNSMAHFAFQTVSKLVGPSNPQRETVVASTDAHAIVLRNLSDDAAPCSDPNVACCFGHLTALATVLPTPKPGSDLADPWDAFTQGPLAVRISAANTPLGGPRPDASLTSPAAPSPMAVEPASPTNADAVVERFGALRGVGANASVLPSPLVAGQVDWDSPGGEFRLPHGLARADQWTSPSVDFITSDVDALHAAAHKSLPPHIDTDEPVAMQIASGNPAPSSQQPFLSHEPMDIAPLSPLHADNSVPLTPAAYLTALSAAEADARRAYLVAMNGGGSPPASSCGSPAASPIAGSSPSAQAGGSDDFEAMLTMIE